MLKLKTVETLLYRCIAVNPIICMWTVACVSNCRQVLKSCKTLASTKD